MALKDGSVINVSVGGDKNDPQFVITDLLPHLGADQMQKKGSNVVEGEALDITFASIPLKGEKKEAVKKNALKILEKKYGVTESDLMSA